MKAERAMAYNWPPAVKVGDVVDYHPVIDEPQAVRHLVRAGPEYRNGYWVVWLEDKPGWVLVDACSPAEEGGAS